MSSDIEREEERSVTPVPPSSLDPDSPLEDSPIFPGSQRREDKASGHQEELFDLDTSIPVTKPWVKHTVDSQGGLIGVLQPSAEPRMESKKSPVATAPGSKNPTPEPRSSLPKPNDQKSELSGLARELQGCTWEQLQQRFTEEMDERSKVENTIQKETADLLELFMAWSQTTTFHDEDRAYKRLKTRMDHVQQSEEALEEKKAHYTNVVKAFESALALLRTE